MSKRSQKPVKAAATVPKGYGPLLAELKSRVRAAQVRAALSVNAHLVWLYWQVGHRIAQQQAKEGWGAGVIPRLAADLHAEFPEMKGFSERNLNYMIRFAREYGAPAILQQPAALLPNGGATPIVPQAAPQLSEDDPSRILQQLAAKLPWFHHVILMEKVKDRSPRLWYMQHAIEHGWSRAVRYEETHRRGGVENAAGGITAQAVARRAAERGGFGERSGRR
jgi:predicted nuclease of restriction endonuclease-like (RecB) superfamily